MGVVLFLWNVFSFACVAVVLPITREVTLPAEFGVGHFDDPKLRRLASFLPAVLEQDRATSTAATYLRAYKSGKQGLSSTVPFIFLQTLWCFLFILCLLSSSPVWCPQLIQQCREWVRSIRKVATQNQASILCRDWSTHHAVVQSNLNFNYRNI